MAESKQNSSCSYPMKNPLFDLCLNSNVSCWKNNYKLWSLIVAGSKGSLVFSVYFKCVDCSNKSQFKQCDLTQIWIFMKCNIFLVKRFLIGSFYSRHGRIHLNHQLHTGQFILIIKPVKIIFICCNISYLNWISLPWG